MKLMKMLHRWSAVRWCVGLEAKTYSTAQGSLESYEELSLSFPLNCETAVEQLSAPWKETGPRE